MQCRELNSPAVAGRSRPLRVLLHNVGGRAPRSNMACGMKPMVIHGYTGLLPAFLLAPGEAWVA